jgi:hypothetical protein
MTETPASLPASGQTSPVPGTNLPAAPNDALTARGRVKAGHDPAVFDKRMSGETSAPASGSARDQTGKFTTPSTVSRGNQDGTNLDLKPAHALEAANRLLAHGVDPELVRAAALESGVDLSKLPQHSEAEARVNAEHGFGGPPRTAADYRFDLRAAFGSELGSMTPADVKSVHGEMTTALADMQFDPRLGASLVEQLMTAARQSRGMTEAQRQLAAQGNKATVVRRWGDQYQARMADARFALDMLGSPEMRASIAGLADLSPWSLETLANHGRRLRGWAADRLAAKG